MGLSLQAVMAEETLEAEEAILEVGEETEEEDSNLVLYYLPPKLCRYL